MEKSFLFYSMNDLMTPWEGADPQAENHGCKLSCDCPLPFLHSSDTLTLYLSFFGFHYLSNILAQSLAPIYISAAVRSVLEAEINLH